MTSDQFDQLTYLPADDGGLNNANQYAFRPNTAAGSPGSWMQVDVATNLGNETSTESVTITSSTGMGTAVADATTARAGVMNTVQAGKVQYLPVADPAFDADLPETQFALVPSSVDGSAGTWREIVPTEFAQAADDVDNAHPAGVIFTSNDEDHIEGRVRVPRLDVNDPDDTDDSVNLRARLGTLLLENISFTGDSRLQVSAGTNTINLNVTGEAPPSHDPYTLSVVETGTGRIQGRRIDVPHETQGGVEVTIEANDGFTIHSIQDIGPVLGISVELLSNYVVRIRGDSSSNVGTFSPHFTVVYTEDTAGTRHMQREDYTLVIEEDFYAGILANTETSFSSPPTALSNFASGDNQGVIANGKSVTVENDLDPAETGTLYLAIPRANYDVSSFEITTNGYPIAIDEISIVEDHQILEVGTFEPGENLTFVIQGVV